MSKTACLIIHGFGGDTREIQPLADFLEEQGYLVLCTALKGHTGKRKDMRGVTWRDWVASAQSDYDRLRIQTEDVRIIGFSMGGLIAVNLALANTVRRVVLLSMPIFHWHRSQIVCNILGDLATGKWDNIRHYLRSSIKFTLGALVNFRYFLHRTKRLLPQLETPVFIAQGLADDTVAPRSADYIRDHVSSKYKELKYYSRSEHLICTGADQTELFDDIARFLERVF